MILVVCLMVLCSFEALSCFVGFLGGVGCMDGGGLVGGALVVGVMVGWPLVLETVMRLHGVVGRCFLGFSALVLS